MNQNYAASSSDNESVSVEFISFVKHWLDGRLGMALTVSKNVGYFLPILVDIQHDYFYYELFNHFFSH